LGPFGEDHKNRKSKIDPSSQHQQHIVVASHFGPSESSLLIRGMSSSQQQNSKLLITAIGAAVAGASLALVLSKLVDRKRQSERHVQPSYIYSSEPVEESTSNSEVLFPYNHEEKMRRRMAARVAIEEDNSAPRRSVTVRVPATSANVGPGCK
jgi:hypothetical protein